MTKSSLSCSNVKTSTLMYSPGSFSWSVMLLLILNVVGEIQLSWTLFLQKFMKMFWRKAFVRYQKKYKNYTKCIQKPYKTLVLYIYCIQGLYKSIQLGNWSSFVMFFVHTNNVQTMQNIYNYNPGQNIWNKVD